MYKYFPKNTGNSNVIDRLIVNNLSATSITTYDLNVGGITYTHGVNSTGDLIVYGNSYLHGAATVDSWIRANSLTTNGVNYFDYADGTWTPSFAFIRSAFKDYPLYPVTYHEQEGYYIKTGRTVTVWFKIRANVPGKFLSDATHLSSKLALSSITSLTR